MQKNIRICLFCLVLFQANFAMAQGLSDAKVKIVTKLSIYGTVGGALIGFASMAYGTSSRSIFQGASLGLYAGLLFSSYVIISHSYFKDSVSNRTYPVNVGENPYEVDGGENSLMEWDRFYRWNDQENFTEQKKWSKKSPFYLPMIYYQF